MLLVVPTCYERLVVGVEAYRHGDLYVGTYSLPPAFRRCSKGLVTI